MWRLTLKKMCASEFCVLLPIVTSLFLCIHISAVTSNECVTVFRSGEVPQNGSFHSPGWPKRNYPNNQRCVYKFIGRPDQRVQIQFKEFRVRGVPPVCNRDYVDVYTQVEDEDADMLEIPLHGRYCGTEVDALPHLLISMYRNFFVGFYTDGTRDERGFRAEYSFIDASAYVFGTPVNHPACGWEIRSDVSSKGIIQSPTYPGMYPDDLYCFYKLQGTPGQRIKFTFLELDLYSGGEHCPFDYVKIHDGATHYTEMMGIYCGRHQNIELFSTGKDLHIEFQTKSGRAQIEHDSYYDEDPNTIIRQTGFKAMYEFSEDFVNLDFIQEGSHVRGTECDQRVLSSGESNGTITSPRFPSSYPLNITCRYYVDGLVDQQNLEKAKLVFDYFDIPQIGNDCHNGYISAYLNGQDITKSPADHQFCGRARPLPMETTDPRLLLLFDTHGKTVGNGFKARYKFVTDYAIPGTPATANACHFVYHSTSAKTGLFNSPRHPSNYPHNTDCVYEFIGSPREHVRITFNNFKIENVLQNCTTDYLEVYTVSSPSHNSSYPGAQPVSTRLPGMTAKMISHLCGNFLPGPIMSDREDNMLRIQFHSNEQDFSSGFKARYEFVPKEYGDDRCFLDSRGKIGGVIRSQNNPQKYKINTTCEWLITTKHPNGQVLLTFMQFDIEGNMKQSGCGSAILKITTTKNTSMPQHELCGREKVLHQIVSVENFMRIQFITSSHAMGGKGFRLIWTEILPVDEVGGLCGQFQCERTHYCIDNSHKCNNIENCGVEKKTITASNGKTEYRYVPDTSDEESTCGPTYNDHGVLHVILGVVITLILLVLILVCILHKRRKARKKKNKQEIEVRYVTRSTVNTLERNNTQNNYKNYNNSTVANNVGMHTADHLLLMERTEKVSIV